VSEVLVIKNSRIFLSISLIGLACTLTAGMAPSRADSSDLLQVAPGVYLRPGIQQEFSRENRGHIANIGFIVGEQRVAVIDTGSSYREGAELRQKIAEITPLPIAYVIITHMHPDHALGAAAFKQDKPLFIGHEALADALVRRQQTYLQRMKEILGEDETEGTRLVFPTDDVAIDQVLRLDLGGRFLQLRAYPTAHTNNDLTVFDEQTGTLWLSDLLFVERIPVLDGSLRGWLTVLDELSKQNCLSVRAETEDGSADCLAITQVVPGHGPVVSDWKAALADEHRYLENTANGIKKIIKAGGTITEAVENVANDERDRWLLFEQYHGRNVTAGFAELEWE
jgi:quinoprotein relay system zinc metallohydrolase 2